LQYLLEEMTEVTDTFVKWPIDYRDKHEISIWNEKQLISYLNMSEVSFEVGNKTSSLKIAAYQ